MSSSGALASVPLGGALDQLVELSCVAKELVEDIVRSVCADCRLASVQGMDSVPDGTWIQRTLLNAIGNAVERAAGIPGYGLPNKELCDACKLASVVCRHHCDEAWLIGPQDALRDAQQKMSTLFAASDKSSEKKPVEHRNAPGSRVTPIAANGTAHGPRESAVGSRRAQQRASPGAQRRAGQSLSWTGGGHWFPGDLPYSRRAGVEGPGRDEPRWGRHLAGGGLPARGQAAAACA